MAAQRALVVKIKFQDDVRRISFKNKPSYSKLNATLQKLFSYLNLDDYVIKYMDEESDLVTVSSDMELNEAISQMTGLLRLYLVESTRASTITASKLGVSVLNPNEALQPAINASSLNLPSGPSLSLPKNPSGPTGPSLFSPFSQPEAVTTTPKPKPSPPVGPNPAVVDVWKKMVETKPELAQQYIASQLANLSKDRPVPAEPQTLPPAEPTEPEVVAPAPTPAPVPAPEPVEVEPTLTPEKVEAPPKKSKPKRYLARFVKNITIPDATEINTCTSFEKIWEMRNDGEHTWPVGTQLAHVGGDVLCTDKTKDIGKEVAPGESVAISVTMTTPEDPGRYVSYWRLITPTGTRFGHRVWVDVLVVKPAQDAVQPPEPQVAEPVEEPTPAEAQSPAEPEPEEPVETPVPTAEPVITEEPVAIAEPSAPAEQPTAASQAITDALRVLADMGFTNAERCTALLYRNNNDLMATIQDLLQGK